MSPRMFSKLGGLTQIGLTLEEVILLSLQIARSHEAAVEPKGRRAPAVQRPRVASVASTRHSGRA